MKLHESLQQWGSSYMTAVEADKVGVMIKLLEVEKSVTLAAVVSKETRSFNQLIKTDKIDRTALLTSISTYFIVMISELFSRDKSVTHTQIVLFTDEFLNIQNLTVEDSIMFMKGIKAGKYGKVYGKIDIPTLNGWLDVYLDERETEFERARNAERKDYDRNSERTNKVPGMVNYEKHMNQLFGKQVTRQTI